jgi:DNA-binding MarR family transcriptional regulator
MRRLRDAHTAGGLSPRQFHVLGLLDDHGAMGQSELAQTMATDPSILVTMLNPLEAEGLISRQRDPEDRRRHLVTLSAAGQQRLRDATDAQREAENALFVGLDDEQREQLRGLLIAVEKGLGRGPSCPASLPGQGCEPSTDSACRG